MTQSYNSKTVPDISEQWDRPGETLCLSDGTVDLWLACLAQPAPVLSRLRGILSEDERATADRQVTPDLRDRSIIARGLLRVLLGRYLGRPPNTFMFSRNRYGKPRLAGDHAGHLSFNKSHSGDLLLYGFTTGQEIGVDLECIRGNINLDRLARRQLTPKEHDLFMRLPDPERIFFFYQIWTRKEAVGKAVGKGLIFQMGSFDVSGTPESPVSFLRRELADHNPDNWYIRDIPEINEGFRASVSTYGRIETVNRFHAAPEYLLARKLSE